MPKSSNTGSGRQEMHGTSVGTSRNHARASQACVSCRERRSRCVIATGAQACTRCLRRNLQCVLRNDDERRNRGNARAHAHRLSERVSMLEGMLRERDTLPAPSSAAAAVPVAHEQNHPRPPDDLPRLTPENHGQPRERIAGGINASCPTPLLAKLLGSSVHARRDHGSVLSYYGPAANCHALAPPASAHSARSQKLAKQESRAREAIQALPLRTHDYLLELFWDHHNDVLFTVHQDAFAQDRHAGRAQHYSAFLHLLLLAMGYRFADKSLPDIQLIARSNRESTLHATALTIITAELDALGGIPCIVALLLLGDLEVGVGRCESGWLYTGLALRLSVEAGLHLRPEETMELSDDEHAVRLTTLRACFVADRFWSLFLGRPISLRLDKERSLVNNASLPPSTVSLRINEAILSLMDIAGRLIDNADSRSAPHGQTKGDQHHGSYFRMAALDRDLRTWLSKLPLELQSSRDNLASGPYSLYLLHQQYYTLLILLHTPFAAYELDRQPPEEEPASLDMHFRSASREICLRSALAMASLFRQHRQRFRGRRTFRMGMQQAGVGATALVAALSSHEDLDPHLVMHSWGNLRLALADLSKAFQPAEDMVVVLDSAMREVQERNTATSTHLGRELPALNSTLALPAQNTLTALSDESRSNVGSPEMGRQHQLLCTPQILPNPPPSRISRDTHATTAPLPPLFATNAPSTDIPANAEPWLDPVHTGPDDWEFESINSVMGVGGLEGGDLMDLLMDFEPTQASQSG